MVYAIAVRTKTSQLRNVTLSAPAEWIDEARIAAQQRGLTLNDAFRKWLLEFAKPSKTPTLEEFVASLGGGVDIGPIPSREERNARR